MPPTYWAKHQFEDRLYQVLWVLSFSKVTIGKVYVFSFWKVSIVSQPSLPQYTFLWYLIDFVRNKWLRKTIRYTHFTLSKNGIFAESFYSLNNFVLLLKKNVHVVMRKPSWFGFTDHECHANSIWDSDRRISLPTENDMVKSKGV